MDRGTEHRITASDVARLAGVSTSTVSKALSGNGPVRRQTRLRVLEAAKELHYRPPLREGESDGTKARTIGVITNDRFGRLTVPVLLGAFEALAQHEIALLLCDGRGDRIREQYFVEMFQRRRIDGILVAGSGAFPRPALQTQGSVPIVYALAWSNNEHDTSFVPHDAGGAAAVAEHLLATGRRRIAYVAGPQRDTASQVRLAEIRRVLRDNGSELSHEPLFGQWSEAWGRQATTQLIHSGVPFDGIACASDQIARGALEVLRENEIRVPQSVAVTGFDNWDVMVEASRPPLTTVDLSLHDVGVAAGLALLHAMKGEPNVARGIHRIDCQLVPRESTAMS
ncbi:LacI family DNA-binding transcriptional regulator [Humibacter ginsengiterrae]